MRAVEIKALTAGQEAGRRRHSGEELFTVTWTSYSRRLWRKAAFEARESGRRSRGAIFSKEDRDARGSPKEDAALLLIDDFLDEGSCARLRKKILATPFVSGSTTAVGMAGSVKNNLQIDPKKGKPIIEEIKSFILNDPRIDLYALPLRIAGAMINRYDEGMEYGNHSDSPIMEGVRCDLSFTVFLEDYRNYDGGELILEQEHGLLKIKPKIGSIFVYSTGSMHRVTKVTRGSRLACVGWIQSRVRDESQRKVLRDLNAVLTAHVQLSGHDAAADLQLKVIGDLLRMWHA